MDEGLENSAFTEKLGWVQKKVYNSDVRKTQEAE